MFRLAPSPRRPGFTLLEMLLVVVVIAMVAALAMPSITGMLSSETLRQSAEHVRLRWGHARLQAMKTGRMHIFLYEPGGAKFRIDVWTAGDEALEASDPLGASGSDSEFRSTVQPDPMAAAKGASAPSNGKAGSLVVSAQVGEEERLPDGLVFLGSATQDARGEALEAEAETKNGVNSLSSLGTTWSDPIFFYPDGTSSTAQLYITDESQKVVRLELRGLTGIARLNESPDEETP